MCNFSFVLFCVIACKALDVDFFFFFRFWIWDLRSPNCVISESKPREYNQFAQDLLASICQGSLIISAYQRHIIIPVRATLPCALDVHLPRIPLVPLKALLFLFKSTKKCRSNIYFNNKNTRERSLSL